MSGSGDRPLPHNLEAERSVLGAAMLNNDAFTLAAEILNAEDYFRHAHQLVWRTIGSLIARGKRADLLSVKDELARVGDLDAVGGPAYLATLDEIPRSSNVTAHAQLVKDKAILRAVIRAAKRLEAQAYAGELEALSLDELSSFLSAPLKSGVAAERIPFKTAADLAQQTAVDVPWFVPGFFAPGVVTEVVGKLKASGKTTFMSHMVEAVLNGRPFLGHRTRLTGVLWLTEERPTTFVETLKRAGLTNRRDLHVVHWHDVKAQSWPAVMRACVAYAPTVGVGMLIVDTVSQFAGLRGDAENNSGDALAAVGPLQDAAAAGLAVVALRHERKGGGEVGESGRGSSAFSGAVDIVVAIRRGEGQTKPTVRVLHTLSRFTETPDTLVIDLTDQGYTALGTEGTVAVLEAERALLDRLPMTEDAALTLDAILDGHEPRIARTVAQEALRKLADVGVQRIGLGRRGNPYRYFRAIELSAGTQITSCGRNGNHAEADCARI